MPLSKNCSSSESIFKVSISENFIGFGGLIWNGLCVTSTEYPQIVFHIHLSVVIFDQFSLYSEVFPALKFSAVFCNLKES